MISYFICTFVVTRAYCACAKTSNAHSAYRVSKQTTINMLQYIITPIVGGVIGYITNDLAIKMLFRPHQPKYFFGHRIPFTPGIIPKEKSRIAHALGDAISENLMNQEVLEKTLLSEELLTKMSRTIDAFCNHQKRNEETLMQFACHYLKPEEVNQIADSVAEELETLITEKLATSNFGSQIAEIAVKHAIEKTASSMLGMLGAHKVLEPIALIAEPLLAKQINEMMQNNSGEIVHNLIKEQSKDLLNLPMSRFFVEHDAQIEQAKSALLSAYRTVILEHLPRILSALDISNIVEQRINEMDMNEIEPLIFEIMDKELKAIIWLGAGLGAIIGCVNIFI